MLNHLAKRVDILSTSGRSAAIALLVCILIVILMPLEAGPKSLRSSVFVPPADDSIANDSFPPYYPTFHLERIGQDYIAREQEKSQRTFKSTNLTLLLNDCMGTMMGTGGKIFFANGIYNLDGVLNIKRTGGCGVKIVGESMNQTIVRSTAYSDMVHAWGDLYMQDITLDGDGKAQILLASGELANMEVRNVHFTNHNSFGIWFGGNIQRMIVSGCIFDHPQSYYDQFAFACQGPGLIENCIFDRTNGYSNGSSLTSGGGNNVIIINNTILRNENCRINGISLEPTEVFNNFFNFTVINNRLVNGDLRVGGPTTRGSVSNVDIINNTLKGGDIAVFFDKNGTLDTVNIVGNSVFHSAEVQGILISHATNVNVLENSIWESNVNNEIWNSGLISVISSRSVTISSNNLIMSLNGTHQSHCGVYLRDSVDVHIIRNNFDISNGKKPIDYVPTEGSNLVIRDNIGAATESNGLIEVTQNQTSIRIPINLVSLPAYVTLSVTNDSVRVLVASVTYQFIEINLCIPPTNESIIIKWRAMVDPNIYPSSGPVIVC